MPSLKLPSDNTDGLSGSIHQLYIALEQCFEMDHPDQYVVIEKLGDVTTVSQTGSTQLEVKAYDEDDALTDSHLNFWNTLRNWLQPQFDISQVKAFVLYTTQPIGERSSFKEWNTADKVRRLSILESIRTKAEDRYSKAVQEKAPAKVPVPESLGNMRYALGEIPRVRLAEVVGKLHISAEMPSLLECYDRILGKHAKVVPTENKAGYVGALFEFIVRPSTIENGWKIGYAEFSIQMIKFGGRFGVNRRTFPTRNAVEPDSLPQETLNQFSSSTFVTKIRDIEFHQKIPSAIADYTHAHQTWLDEFSKHQTLMDDYHVFAQDLRRIVEDGHAASSLECEEVMVDSKRFYLKMTGGELPIPAFPNMDPPNISYRNGVIHTLMDRVATLCWKLSI